MKKGNNNSDNSDMVLNIRTNPQIANTVRESIMLILHGFYYVAKNEKSNSWIDLDQVSFPDMIYANFDEKEIKNLFEFLKCIDLELDKNDKIFLEMLEKEFFSKNAKNIDESSSSTTKNTNFHEKIKKINESENVVYIKFKNKD